MEEVVTSYSTVSVLRHLETTRRGLPPPAPATEQMSPALDALSLQFAIWMRSAPDYGLDIGCGDGIATAAALARGGHVMALDKDQCALDQVLRRVPAEQFPRLRLRRARLEEIDFKFAHFSAVHASRVLHLVERPALQQSFRKFFRWLYPDGKLFVSAFTPSGSSLRPRRSDAADRVQLLDESTLRWELTAAGFIVEKLTSSALAWDAGHTCANVIARCGP